MNLLIIGELTSQVAGAAKIARKRGANVLHAENNEIALELLRSGKNIALIMAEVKTGIANLIKALREERFHCEIVACGIETNRKAAAQAIRDGASEYIPLPPNEELIAAILEGVSNFEQPPPLHASKKMQDMLKMADKVAASNANILITGESGTGKEVIAQYIHRKSKRKNKQFVSVNCAAIPENLLESELFGHEKGAFTGAAGRRIGKFEESSGGTLLLDEISEMDLRLQSKLLRAIQEKEIDRIGGSKAVKVDLRVIATSNRDLRESVNKGEFREDLLFRLNVINLHIPPLREREEDIELLAKHFAQKYADHNSLENKALSDKALIKLHKSRWQGNVRELENCIHRAVLMSSDEEISEDDVILQDEMGLGRSDTTSSPLVGKTLESVEKELVIQTLNHCHKDHNQAAKLLGISIKALKQRLEKYMQ